MEIDIGELILQDEIDIGDLELDIIKEYPILEVKEHYLEEMNLVIELSNNQILVVDISEYIASTELTPEQIDAINNMTVLIENGELIFEYDEELLNIKFILDNDNLIVDENLDRAEFNINESGEMEVSY